VIGKVYIQTNMCESGRGWSNFRTESKEYGAVALIAKEEDRDAYVTTNMGQLRSAHKMATNRTVEAARSDSSIPEDLFSSTDPRKKKASFPIKTPKYGTGRASRGKASPSA
jgi:hypothetical protein